MILHGISDEGDEAVKVLVIVHRMAAKRLGFGDLYAALNDRAPEKFKNGFLDGTAWPVRPFNGFVLPLVSASKQGREFEVMQILRSQSPLLDQKKLSGVNVAERLDELRQFTEILQQMMEPGSGATNADVLRHVHESRSNRPRPEDALIFKSASPGRSEGRTTTTRLLRMKMTAKRLPRKFSPWTAFLACPASQFWGYYKYVNEDSPFSTQQGIKGAEFERVLVVLDDDEGTHVQFSYDKYLGIKPLSDRDEANRREGKETTVERTRRLFYVCCTRAMKDLIVVLFTADVAAAQRQITALGLFPADAIHLEDELEAK